MKTAAATVETRKLAPLIQFQNATFKLGSQTIFPRVNWRWNPGEQWAILGLNGSGKSLFVQAL